jgi:hypothetical protein
MRNAAKLTFLTLLGAMALAGSAHAQADYVNYLPNGLLNNCQNCHPGGDTAQLNLFGQASSNLVGQPTTDWWPALVDLDSDGDLQTNGQEMGDPCGDWLIGLDPPRTTAISNPGDAADQSADPDTPACDPGGGGAGGGASTGAGATTGAGAGSGSTGAGATGAGAGGPSTGAGRADPPLTAPESCAFGVPSTNPTTPGAAWDIGMLAGAALMLARYRRRKRR